MKFDDLKNSQLLSAIEKAIEVKDSVIKPIEGQNPFMDNLPDGLNPELLDLLADYRQDYVAAAALACGRLAVEQFKKDEGVNKITANIALHSKDYFELDYTRNHEVSWPDKNDPNKRNTRVVPVHVLLRPATSFAAAKNALGEIKEHLASLMNQ